MFRNVSKVERAFPWKLAQSVSISLRFIFILFRSSDNINISVEN